MALRLGVIGILFMVACITPRSTGPDKESDGKDRDTETAIDSGDTADSADTGIDTGLPDEEDMRPRIVCLEGWSTASGQAGVYMAVDGNEDWDFGTTDYLVEGWDVPSGGDKLCNVVPSEYGDLSLIFNGWDDPNIDPSTYAADPENFSDWGSFLVYACTEQGTALLYDQDTGRCSDVSLSIDGHTVTEFHPDPEVYNLYAEGAPVDG